MSVAKFFAGAFFAYFIICNFGSAQIIRNQCQQWCCRISYPGVVTMRCCNDIEQAGQCPAEYCQFRHNTNLDLRFVACNNDRECPWGFKCCFDYCNKRKICRPVRKSETTSSEPTESSETTPSSETTKSPDTITSSETAESPEATLSSATTKSQQITISSETTESPEAAPSSESTKSPEATTSSETTSDGGLEDDSGDEPTYEEDDYYTLTNDI